MNAGQRRPIDAAASVLELGRKAAAAYGRDDLVRHLTALGSRLRRPEVHVAVVGQFKSGKSALVNALLGADVCPVDDGLSTTAPTVVRWAEAPAATASFERSGEEATAPRHQAVSLDELADLVSEAGNPGNRRGVRLVEVGIPRPVLEAGLVLVDTPGAGGLLSPLAAPMLASLSTVDAVVFSSASAQELSRPEIDLLAAVVAACPTVLVALTKIDLSIEWRRIAELDRAHLAAHGLDLPVVGLSTALRRHAIDRGDEQANEESGYPALGRWIRRAVSSVATLHVQAVAHEVGSAAVQMAAAFEAERSALAEGGPGLSDLHELDRARRSAESMRTSSARWAQRLNDGLADVTADIDHGLRDRMRRVLETAEHMVDDVDPLTEFDELVAWMRQRASAEVVELYRELDERMGALASDVDELFAEERASLRALGPSGLEVGEILEGIGLGDRPQRGDRAPVLGLTALRGGYIGMLMFTTLGSLAGLAVLTPVAGVVGLLMGRKALRDEKQRQLTLRRQQVKVAVRRYVDDVTFHVGKDARDALRRLHRELRDQFSARAEELSRAATASLRAAQDAASLAGGQRDQRRAQVEAELKRLSELGRRASALLDLASSAGEDEPAGEARQPV